MLQQCSPAEEANCGTAQRAGLPAVATLLFCSGAAALIFQVGWLRELRLVFGTSTSATAAVLGIFMGGLGVGNWLLGPRADRHQNPLMLYAWYLLLIAVSGAVSPWLCDAVRGGYIALGGQTALGIAGASVVRLGLSALVLGLPTILMGGTLPAAVRAVTADDDRSRRGLGLLYGANELGAVLGAAASTFYLLEHLGTRATLWLACGIYLATAGAARRLAARGGEQGAGSREQGEDKAVGDMPAALTPGPSPATMSTWCPGRGEIGNATTSCLSAEYGRGGMGNAVVYAASGLVGFAFFVMELVWYRMLGPILGGTTFTFGLILAVVVAGIGLGGALYAVIFRRLKPTFGALAATCSFEAVAMAYPLAWGDGLAMLVAVPRPGGLLGLHSPILGWTAVVALVVLPAAVISGIQFPLLVALLGEGRRDVGKQVGRAFAWNTAGAVGGSLVGGFGLLPWLTAPGAWRAMVIVLAAVAGAAITASLRRERRTLWLALPAAAIAAAMVMVRMPGPSAAWRHSGIGAGRAGLTDGKPNNLRAWLNANRRTTIWEAEGVEASIAIRNDAALSFFVNGKCDGNSITDASTQVMGGLVGAILNGSPKTAFVLGLGTGESAGWLAEIPCMERVDVVELEPAVTEMARRCAAVNHGVLEHPKVRLMHNDAREVLLTTAEKYDVIFSEPSNPYRAGIASLYTAEFYQAVRGRMKTGAIFAQFVQAYEIEEETVRTILATLSAVFPHIEVWQTNHTDLLLLGCDRPPAYDNQALRERISQEPYRSALRNTWQTWDLEGFLARFVAGPQAVAGFLSEETAVPNTDDRNRLEYSFARSVGRATGFSIETLRERAIANGGSRPPVEGKLDWTRVEDQRQLMHGFSLTPCPERKGMSRQQKTRAEIFHQFALVNSRKMVETYEAAPYEPASPAEAAALAMALVLEGRQGDRTERLLGEVQGELPAEAEILHALQMCGKDNTKAAEGLVKAFQLLRSDPWIMPQLGSAAVRAAVRLAYKAPGQALRLRAALAEPFAVEVLHDERCRAMLTVGDLAGAACAFEDLQRFEPYVPWEEEILQIRARAYLSLCDARAWQATRDLEEFKKNAAAQGGP